jgi:hypothetical protein
MHRRIRVVVLGALLAALAVGSASATVRIKRDAGGRVGAYIEAFAMVRNSGQQVVIDGACLSACTLVLGIVPRERICATSNALLGFHAAWSRDNYGRAVRNSAATQILWDIYPEEIRGWIARNGGLNSKMIYLRGRELAAVVPPCRGATQRAKRAPGIAPARRQTPATFANKAGE